MATGAGEHRDQMHQRPRSILSTGTHSTPNLHPHLQVVQRPAPPGPLYQAQNHGGHSLLLCCTPGPSST
ncbi:hypothetical protein ATANTOWER_002106 [Ataeniobius toweri]|uniref:Uncharacterized protein n=1 Tax=Ataeniobius toweri TaxID=208326 RepID=A0ABU7BYE5_9TELE|nr:hypothetical protein [Ataeniobius toweri]